MSDFPERSSAQAPTVAARTVQPASASEPATLHVHVRNVSDAPQDFIVSLRGLEAAWGPGAVVAADIPADATCTVELPITPPAGTPPGDYPYLIEVEARAAGGGVAESARTVLESVWTVDAHSEIVLSVEPADSRSLTTKKVRVQLANASASEREVTLNVTSERGLGVKLGANKVKVGPHATTTIPARLRAGRPRLLHNSSRRSFTVVATGNQIPSRFQGTHQSRALLPSGVMRVVALVAVLALWAVGAITALPWLANRFDADKRADVAISTQAPQQDGSADPVAGDAGAGDGESGDGGADGAGGGAGGSDEPSGTDSEGSATEQVRVSGAILGSTPGGVTVSIEPASTIAGVADAEATNAGGQTSSAMAGVGHAITGGDVAAAPLSSTPLTAASAVWHQVGESLADNLLGATDSGSDKSAGKVSREALAVQASADPEESRSTTTAADGTWAFAGVNSTSRYLVTLSKPGYQTARYFMTGAEAASVPLEVELEAGRGTVSGTVTGPSGKAGGVEITLTDGTTTLSTRTATRGNVGSWSVSGLSTPSTYLITASGEGLGSQSRLVEVGADATRTVDMTLKRGVASVTGTISGSNSLGTFSPLGSISVVATDGDTERAATTVTAGKATGTFILPDLPVPGTYTVTVSGDGYLTQVQTVKLTAKNSSTNLKLQLGKTGGTIVGTVKDEDETGLTGAGMVLTSDDNVYKTMSSSDGEGGFRFDGVASGTYVLSGQIFGHETAFAQVRVRDGRTASADLILTSIDGNGLTETSRIRGRAVDATTGASITCPHITANEVCAVTVKTDVTRRNGSVETITAIQQPDAQYTLPGSGGLLPGSYELTFTAPGYEPATVTVEVAMDRIVEAATAALFPSPSISGNVLTRVGALPTGTCVVATAAGATAPTTYQCQTAPDNGCQISGTTDGVYCGFADNTSMGAYQINRLPSGTYQARTYVPGGTEYISDTVGVTLTLQGGDAKRYDATLDRKGRLAVTALISTGTGRLLAGDGVHIVAQGPGDPVSGGANASGYVMLTGLLEGVYTVTATASGPTRTGQVTGLTVGLNQEISVQLVITSGVPSFDGEVVTQLLASATDPVEGASITITGVIEYDGVVAQRDSATVTATGPDGQFVICTEQPCATDSWVTYLPLLESQVDVEVTRAHYDTVSRNNVDISSLKTITLDPTGVPFTGTVNLIGVPAATAVDLYENVGFTVLSAPPGTGAVSLSADDTGHVTWIDSQQRVDPAGGRYLRPGTYRIQAALPGFDPVVVEFTVAPGDAGATANFTMNKYGNLRVFAMAPDANGDPVAIEGATMEIELLDGTTRTIEASATRTYVDFGSLPSGTYTVTVWQASYAESRGQVVVAPGQTTNTTPENSPQVTLVPLSAVTGKVYTAYQSDWKVELSGATVRATPTTGDPFTASTISDGSYRITGTKTREGLTDGSWTITASAPGHSPITPGSSATVGLTAPNTRVDTPVPDLALSPQRGGLQIVVVDPVTNQEITGTNLNVSVSYNDGTHQVFEQSSVCAGNAVGYCFEDLLPLTYTLTIVGGGYAPLVTVVTVESGITRPINIAMTSPGGSLQGTVTLQAGAQTTLAEGATVTLRNATTDAVIDTDTTEAGGTYHFDNVAAGNYKIHATHTTGTGNNASTLEATRTVVLGIAQSLIIDLALVQPTATVTVTLTSEQGYDLTGALIAIKSGATEQLAAQPAVRDSATSNTYSTTFSQVRYGTWSAIVSGPADHLGTHESTTSTTVDAANSAGTIPVTIKETRLTLKGEKDSGLTGVPSTLSASIADLSPVTVPIGDSAIVYIPQRSSARLVDGSAGNWNVEVTGGSVAGDATTHTTTLRIRKHQVALSLAAPSPATVEVDGNVTFTYSLSSPTATQVTGGSVQLLRGTTVVDTQPAALGSGSFTYQAALPLSPATFHVAYTGANEFEPATSGNQSITIQQKTHTIAIASTEAKKVTATLSEAGARNLTSAPATFKIQILTGSTWGDVTAGCNYNNGTGVLTCNNVTEGVQARAVYTNSDTSTNPWSNVTSSEVTVMASPPNNGNGNP